MTPLLLSRWKRQTEPSAMRKMATGAIIVALAYSLLAGLAAAAPGILLTMDRSISRIETERANNLAATR